MESYQAGGIGGQSGKDPSKTDLQDRQRKSGGGPGCNHFSDARKRFGETVPLVTL